MHSGDTRRSIGADQGRHSVNLTSRAAFGAAYGRRLGDRSRSRALLGRHRSVLIKGCHQEPGAAGGCAGTLCPASVVVAPGRSSAPLLLSSTPQLPRGCQGNGTAGPRPVVQAAARQTGQQGGRACWSDRRPGFRFARLWCRGRGEGGRIEGGRGRWCSTPHLPRQAPQSPATPARWAA